MIIFALLMLVTVLVLSPLREYTRLEFVEHVSLLLKTWSVKLGATGALVGVWAQPFPDTTLHAWAVLPPDIKNILPPNIVALINPALVVLAVLSQYVRQLALKGKAGELKEQQWALKLSRDWRSSSWVLLLAYSTLVMLAGPVRRKPGLISNVPKRTPLLLSPRQNAVLKSRKGLAVYRKTLNVWVMAILIEGYAKSLPAPVVVNTTCNWVRVIYLIDYDIDVLDKQAKRDILTHNKAVQANCSQLAKEGSR